MAAVQRVSDVMHDGFAGVVVVVAVSCLLCRTAPGPFDASCDHMLLTGVPSACDDLLGQLQRWWVCFRPPAAAAV